MGAQPETKPLRSEDLARKELEEQRGASYSDEEWAAVRERLLAFVRLLRDWTEPVS